MPIASTLGILFYIRKDKARENKTCPIYLRITVNGLKSEYAVKRYVREKLWLQDMGMVKGNSEEAVSINDYLQSLQGAVMDAQTNLINSRVPVTAEAIRNFLTGKKEKSRLLLETFKYHNRLLRDKVGTNYAPATFTRYETTLEHMRSFIKKQFSKSDIFLEDLNHAFITELERYFKVTKKCNHNTTMKYIKNLKRVVHFAMELEWLDKDPFIKFKTPIREVKREALTKEELLSLETKEIDLERLDAVRDIFVFCCYTGLSYVDVYSLTEIHVVTGIDGNKWLHTIRRKTKTKANIPLLPKALQIIEKYRLNEKSNSNVKLLPVNSNQKMNAYLKEIAGICHISKVLTFHLARHTFATTVTLANGVPIETVSVMLGHKNLRTTQIYAKVIDTKISDDMMKLREKLTEIEVELPGKTSDNKGG